MSHIIRGGVLSYPNLFVPKLPPNPRPGQKARFSAMVLIPNDVDIQELQKVCFGLLKEKFGDKTDELLKAGMQNQPNGIRWPFRKDNLKRDGSKRYDETKYKCFITPWSESEPGKVDRYVGTDGKPLKILIPDQSKLYAGAIVNVSVNPFVYDNSGNRGVNLGLVNIQHWGEGERLDNRVAAEDEFSGEQRPEVDVGTLPNVTAPVVAGVKGSTLQDLLN